MPRHFPPPLHHFDQLRVSVDFLWSLAERQFIDFNENEIRFRKARVARSAGTGGVAVVSICLVLIWSGGQQPEKLMSSLFLKPALGLHRFRCPVQCCLPDRDDRHTH